MFVRILYARVSTHLILCLYMSSYTVIIYVVSVIKIMCTGEMQSWTELHKIVVHSTQKEVQKYKKDL